MKTTLFGSTILFLAILGALVCSSCQSFADGVFSTVEITLVFSGSADELYYYQQVIPEQKNSERRTAEENRILQGYYQNEIQKGTMQDSIKVPGSTKIRISNKERLFLKFDTSKISSDIFLDIYFEGKKEQEVTIRKQNLLGSQIVAVH